jgi:putative SOS response-associated peptidase YedK
MPVIPALEDYASLLDQGKWDAGGFLALLRPTQLEPPEMHPVSQQLNSPHNNRPEIIRPVSAQQRCVLAP